MTHELSLMTDLLRKIDEVVRQDGGAGRVLSVRVRLGALANISADHFRGHFIDAARGTVAEGAELEINSSDDRTDPHALDITLESVEVEI